AARHAWPGAAGRPARSLVAGGPIVALPGLHLHRIQPDQPARLVHGGDEVLRSVLTEVAEAHALGHGHPFTVQAGLLDDLCPALRQHLALAAVLVDGDRAAAVGL